MTNSITYCVVFFALKDGRLVFGDDGQAVWERIVWTEDLDKAVRMYHACASPGGTLASAKPSAEAFGEGALAEYIHAFNTGGRPSAELASEDTCTPCQVILTEDRSRWAAIDIRTPAQLSAYLDAGIEREREKYMRMFR